MRSSGKGVQTSRERLTGAHQNGKLVRVRGTLRCKRLGHYVLVVATGEGSHNHEYRFTILCFSLSVILPKLEFSANFGQLTYKNV